MKGMLASFGALAAILAVAGLASADFSMHLQGPRPTIEAIYSEGDRVFIARLDGVIQALDRNGEAVVWETVPVPGGRALDLVSEPGGPLYVATSIDGNSRSEPIVAIDKVNGTVLWRSTTAYQAAGIEHFFDGQARALEKNADVYRLALDTGRDSPYLWAGTEHGYVVMLEKATGAPVMAPGGSARVLVPSSADRLTPLSGVPCLRPSGIYALSVHHEHLWAARNFGGVDKQGACANPLLTSLFNQLYWLNASVLVDPMGRPAGVDNMTVSDSWVADPIDPASCTTQCPNGRRFARPSMFDIHIQGTARETQVYFGGAITGKAGAVFPLHIGAAPGDVGGGILMPRGPAITFDDEDLEFRGGALAGTTVVPLGERSIVSDVGGDGNHIYATTWQNQTQGMNVPPGGFAVKFLPGLGTPVDWIYNFDTNDEVRGRSWEAGDVNALYVEPGPNGEVLVGHGNARPPFPDPGQTHETGALLVATPKGRDPVPVLMLPYAGDILAGQSAVAFRVDHPLDDAQSPVKAELEWTLGMTSESWTSLGTLNLASAPGNDYSITNNVPLGQLPERDDIRVRVKVTGRDGLVGTDRTDAVLTVDRTAPIITAFGVQGLAGEVRHAAAGNPIVRTASPTFFVRGNDTCPLATAQCGASDIDPNRSYLWIDDPSHTYPFLDFQETSGYFRGFTFDMSKPHTYGGLPSRLSDGPHVVHAELVDFAGNFDFKRWSIDVDTGVKAPTILPLDAAWVGSSRPTWTAQFLEEVEVVAVRIDGALASGYQNYPKHSVQNPDGTRLVVRAPSDLVDGHVATLQVDVRDRAGNPGGPYVSKVRIDLSGPTFTQITPAQDALLPEGRPTISVQVRDNRSGVAVGATRFLLDGQEQPGARFEADRVAFAPATSLASGLHSVVVETRDLAGNAASHSWTFTVDAQAPAVTLRASVPDGQVAAKRGDEVRIEALVPGGTVNVTVDARALDPAAKAVPAQAQGAGRYVAVVKVAEARTGDLQVLATATDAAGHKGTSQAFVTVDNKPPVAFMLELPAKVAHSFLISWSQDGEKDATHYILEAQVDNGPWKVIDAQVRNTMFHWDPVNAPATLRFRISAVDGAGNRQAAPSNVAETSLVASPIDTILLPDPWPLNGSVIISLAPVPSARLRSVHAELTLPDGRQIEQILEPAGSLFRSTWNVSTTSGTGRLDLTLEDEGGATLRISHAVTFQDGRARLALEEVKSSTAHPSATRGVPAPALGLVLVALAALVSTRRR